MKKILGIVVLGLMLNNCAPKVFRSHFDLQKKEGVTPSQTGRENEKHFYTEIEYANGTRYIGEVNAESKWNREGILLHPNEISIECTWKNNQIASDVKITYLDGATYLGKINKRLEKHGWGSYISTCGTISY